VIIGLAGNDTLLGGAGDDVIEGGPGNDVIVGGPGADRLYGGPGSDTIYANDGERDYVDCGPGVDRAVVDAVDIVKNCEVVVVKPPPGG
jgi:Ca2+-binding RTX toxin-like protein